METGVIETPERLLREEEPEAFEDQHLEDAEQAVLTSEEAGAKHSEALDTFELEEIAFTFQKITLENKDAKTSASDDWKA